MFIFATANKKIKLMLLNKIIKIVLLLLSGIYIVLQGFDLKQERIILSTIILVLLVWLYVGWTKHKSKLFFLFLATYTLAEALRLLAWYIPGSGWRYFTTNILYIASYVLLIVKIIRSLDLKKVFSELKIPIIVLVVLDVFCVSLISGTTKSALSSNGYILEYIYNAVVMALLSFALINYLYRNNNKSMLFLIGSIFILFSEIFQLAYYYILKDNSLRVVYALFLVVAFVFFYLQSQHKVTEPVAAYSDSDEHEPFEVQN